MNAPQYKALPAPYGDGRGLALSLRREGEMPPEDALREALYGCGSPPEHTGKVVDCLRHSRRFDCRVTDHFRSKQPREMMVSSLREVGITVILEGPR